MKEIYLDNSATTRPYPVVTAKVAEMLAGKYGNPSSLHRPGRGSREELEAARRQVADAIAVSPTDIYFTSGGTEAANLAILGACQADAATGKHIVTTVAEHAAVTKAVRSLKRQGWAADYIPAPGGSLDLAALEQAVTAKTALVSVMLVNNETGCIFPVAEVKRIIEKKGSPALLHCDAVQGFGKLPFTAAGLGADLISVSAHKIHGVMGAGALYARQGIRLQPLMFGGGQEQGLRPGTESAPLIAAFGEAVRITFAHLAEDIARMASLRNYCLQAVRERLPGAVINSSPQGAPHIVNFSLPRFPSKQTVEYLDNKGIYISGGAACKSNYSRGPSVLESLGLSRKLAESALRVSFSTMNTRDEIDALIVALGEFCRSQD